jgi:hypothetical protein
MEAKEVYFGFQLFFFYILSSIAFERTLRRRFAVAVAFFQAGPAGFLRFVIVISVPLRPSIRSDPVTNLPLRKNVLVGCRKNSSICLSRV